MLDRRNISFYIDRMAEFPIIGNLGGRDAVFTHLAAKGLVKTPHAIRMWGSADRGVIPGDAARELMRWAEERGIPYTAADFELPPSDRGESAA